MEKEIEKYLVQVVERTLKGMCLKFLPVHFTGLPDRICLIPGGRIIFVELKAPGKKPSKIQMHVHAKLRKLGFEVVVLDSIESVKKFIMRFFPLSPPGGTHPKRIYFNENTDINGGSQHT